jgi:hypothetical protein
MAAGTLPRPGTEYGPCEDDCEHTDCEATKTQAANECPLCHIQIGYGIRFYQRDDGLVHARCVEKAP